MARESEAKNSRGVQQQNMNRDGGESEQGGEKLEQLTSFIKENWKTILTDLVTAGVNAYLIHGKKTKEANEKTRIANH
jgi:hypothetical protein